MRCFRRELLPCRCQARNEPLTPASYPDHQRRETQEFRHRREDIAKRQLPAHETGLHRRCPDLPPELEHHVWPDEVVVTLQQFQRCFRQQLLHRQRRALNKPLPPPSYCDQGRDERDESACRADPGSSQELPGAFHRAFSRRSSDETGPAQGSGPEAPHTEGAGCP